jgi:hypothetical protein
MREYFILSLDQLVTHMDHLRSFAWEWWPAWHAFRARVNEDLRQAMLRCDCPILRRREEWRVWQRKSDPCQQSA